MREEHRFGGQILAAKYPVVPVSEDDTAEGWCGGREARSLLGDPSAGKLIRLARLGAIPSRRIGRNRVYPRRGLKRLVADGGLDGR